jgi:trehalose 6-phosphate phosphatase
MLKDALFLDVDGSLLETPPTPDALQVPHYLADMLHQAGNLLDGALALISTRQLRDVDHLFEPYRFAAVGGQGSEVRRGDGIVEAARIDHTAINSLHEACGGFIGSSHDIAVEYQSYGVCIHCELAPEAEVPIREYLRCLLPRIGAELELSEAKGVFRIRPKGRSVGSAICDLMQSTPFRGRRPVYVGNLAGPSGVAIVHRLGGIAVSVGEDRSMPQPRFRDSCDVHRMLAVLLRRTPQRSRSSLGYCSEHFAPRALVVNQQCVLGSAVSAVQRHDTVHRRQTHLPDDTAIAIPHAPECAQEYRTLHRDRLLQVMISHSIRDV